MTEKELELNILALTKLAKSMNEPDRTFKLNEIDALNIQLQGIRLSDLKVKLEQVTFVDPQVINKGIIAVERATKTQKTMVETFDFGVKLIKTALRS
jgi:hypothetical protein